jgi:uncharacterized repeat protein (TIGR01451 family)
MAVAVASCTRALWSGRLRSTKANVFAVVVLAGLVMIGATPLFAQSPYFPNFNSTTNLVLNGTATATKNGVLQLTTSAPSQVGSAWYSVLQPVAGGFSTTFTFRIFNPSELPADGIAFVIQNSPAGTSVLGVGGGGIGYQGIPNSLAIEFDTFQNPWDPNANHIAIQSCGTNANSADHTATYPESKTPCEIAIASELSELPVNLSDGKVHTVRIDYSLTQCDGESCVQNPNIQVTIDGHALFGNGVSVNLSTLLNLASTTEEGPLNSAYVGVTGATGADYETQDILSWSFTPAESQTITLPAPANQFTTFTFGSYLYKVRPNQNISSLAVTEVPIDPRNFDPGPNFQGAQCITYDSTGGKCIEFHAVCTPANPADLTCFNVSYDVVTSYDVPTGTQISSPGFLKATGESCPPQVPFDSNIITQFIQTRTDPTTKGSSKPTFSCFVAVQNVIYQPADLDIINLAAPRVRPGSTLTYVATVTDFGPAAPAQGVAIKNTIPAGTTYVNSSLCSLTNGCSNAPCTFDGAVATCQVGNLAEFGLEFMVVNVKVAATAIPGTVISDTATITGFNPDPSGTPDRSWTTKTLVSNREE